jgi:hypothetical protein
MDGTRVALAARRCDGGSSLSPAGGRARARAVPVDGHETASGSVGAVASKNTQGDRRGYFTGVTLTRS